MYLGIRQLKNGYKPKTYHFKDKDTGKHVNVHNNAEYAANHLATKTWGRGKQENGEPKPAPTGRNNSKIVKQQLNFNTNEITYKELEDYLKPAKEGKQQAQTKSQLSFSWK